MGGKRAGLGIFITAGDPNLEISQKIFDMLPDFGADFIELGMPFQILWQMALQFSHHL